MSLDLATMRKPTTRANWPTDKAAAAFTVAGNVGKPATTGDANVYPIPLVVQGILDGLEDTSLQEVEEFWQLQFNTDSALSDCLVTIWCHNYWTGDWHPWAKIKIKGDTLLGGVYGRVWTDNGTVGTDYVGVQVENHAGQELYVTHMTR